MRVIRKFRVSPIMPGAVLEMGMPEGAEILSAQTHRASCVLWAIVDTAKPVVKRRLMLIGNDEDLPVVAIRLFFVGTMQIPVTNLSQTVPEPLVMHLFDLGEESQS